MSGLKEVRRGRYWGKNQFPITGQPAHITDLLPLNKTPMTNTSELGSKSGSFLLSILKTFPLHITAVGFTAGGACVQNWEGIEEVIAMWTGWVVNNDISLWKCNPLSCHHSQLSLTHLLPWWAYAHQVSNIDGRQTDRTMLPKYLREGTVAKRTFLAMTTKERAGLTALNAHI